MTRAATLTLVWPSVFSMTVLFVISVVATWFEKRLLFWVLRKLRHPVQVAQLVRLGWRRLVAPVQLLSWAPRPLTTRVTVALAARLPTMLESSRIPLVLMWGAESLLFWVWCPLT